MSKDLPPITHILIDRGQYVDAAGVGVGPWLYFISFIFADGCQCVMNDVATHALAIAEATELAEDCDRPFPIVDATLGGWVH